MLKRQYIFIDKVFKEDILELKTVMYKNLFVAFWKNLRKQHTFL